MPCSSRMTWYCVVGRWLDCQSTYPSVCLSNVLRYTRPPKMKRCRSVGHPQASLLELTEPQRASPAYLIWTLCIPHLPLCSRKVKRTLCVAKLQWPSSHVSSRCPLSAPWFRAGPTGCPELSFSYFAEAYACVWSIRTCEAKERTSFLSSSNRSARSSTSP